MGGQGRVGERYEPWLTLRSEVSEPRFDDQEAADERVVAYPQAIREALVHAMTVDPSVFVMGQGVDDPGGMFGTTRGLHEEFGRERCLDTPLAENALTGVAVGAALAGMRPVFFHNRPDFMYLAMDQIANHAAKWSYMFGGAASVPLVVWTCIGRGWGSAAQHSQANHGVLHHVPGLKLLMPATAFDAKGLMLAAIADKNPVIIMEHRLNLKQQGRVPADAYSVPIGKGVVRRRGGDVTVVAISYMVVEAFRAAEQLAQEGIETEIVDPRTLRPLDAELILESVAKTGRLVVADVGWRTGGVGAEIAAVVAERGFESLVAPIRRVASPDVPTPAGYTLENAFYPGAEQVAAAVREVMG